MFRRREKTKNICEKAYDSSALQKHPCVKCCKIKRAHVAVGTETSRHDKQRLQNDETITVVAKYKKGIQRSPSCVLPHTGLKEGGETYRSTQQKGPFRDMLVKKCRQIKTRTQQDKGVQ